MKINFNSQRAFSKPLRNNITHSQLTFVGYQMQRDSVSFGKTQKSKPIQKTLEQKDYKPGVSNAIFYHNLILKHDDVLLGDNVIVRGSLISDKGDVKAGNNLKVGYLIAKKDIELGDDVDVANHLCSMHGSIKVGDRFKADIIMSMAGTLEVGTIKELDRISFEKTNSTPNNRELTIKSEDGKGTKLYIPKDIHLIIKTPSGDKNILNTFVFMNNDCNYMSKKNATPMTKEQVKKFISVEKI